MSKCQHGQKITNFCATDCCAWKQAAGCQACIKKYHKHMGTTVFLTEQQVKAIVKNYTMDSSVKPKCRVLRETIYSYFTLIKTEITASIDVACKNIINQIGYPYLYANNTLSTYKRLKNKQYRKLGQKDFKCLYELTQKIADKDLVNEQAKIYLNQMKNTQQLMNALEDNFKNYKNLLKKHNPGFVHDLQHIAKINQIFKLLNHSESPKPKVKDEKKPISPVYQFKEKSQTNDRQEKEETKPIQLQRMAKLGIPPSLARPNFSRDVSIDKQTIKQPRFVGATPKQEKQDSQKQLIQQKHKLFQRQRSERIEPAKQQLTSRQVELNKKKNMLIQMMKQKEESVYGKQKSSTNLGERRSNAGYMAVTKTYSLQPWLNQIESLAYNAQPSEKIRAYTEPATNQIVLNNLEKDFCNEPQINIKISEIKNTVQQKGVMSTNEETKSNKDETKSLCAKSQRGSSYQLQELNYKANIDLNNYAFTQLPVQQKVPQNLNAGERVGKKLVVIPNMGFKQNQNEEVSSPLLKKKNLIDRYRQSIRMAVSIVNDKETKQQTKVQRQTKESQKIFDLIPLNHKKSEALLQLRQNQETSLALLLKSLTLKAEQAILYLQKAIVHAQNNLSAAQYLSFLYLQLNRPSDCLKLCNKTLEKIQNSKQPDDLSLIMNNNKAAALNILGRYSQSIVLLQKCLRYREKDYLYKNLGDAYFSISIYEKATYNYEKALRLNDQHDEAHYNLAVCQYSQQNYHNAKLSIEKAIELDPLKQQYHELLNNIVTRITHY